MSEKLGLVGWLDGLLVICQLLGLFYREDGLINGFHLDIEKNSNGEVVNMRECNIIGSYFGTPVAL